MKSKYIVVICTLIIIILSSVSIMGYPNGGTKNKQSPWPTYSHDYQRVGFTNISVKDNEGELIWKYEAAKNYPSSPTLDSNANIYFSSKDGLHSLNDKGEINWVFESNAASSPTVGPDGNIFVGTAYGKILCINNQGEEIWEYIDPQGNPIQSSPIVTDEMVYITSTKPSRLYAIYKENGTEKWNKYVHPGYASSPALDSNGILYLSCSDWFNPVNPKLSTYAFYPNGTLVFKFTPNLSNYETTIFTDPAIGKNGMIYVAFDRQLFALNKKGEIEWQVEIGKVRRNSPSIDEDGTVFIGTKEGLKGVTKYGVVWQMNISDVSSPVISSDGNIIVGMDQSIYSVAIEDNEVNWRYETNGKITTSPAISYDGTVYMFSDDGALYAIGSIDENKSNEDENSPTLSSPLLFMVIVSITILYDIKHEKGFIT